MAESPTQSTGDFLRAESEAAQARLSQLEAEYEELLADSGVIQEDRDTTARLVTSARAHAASARDALERFEAGTYGRCEHCGQEISVERLEAVPDATRCATCSRL